MIGHKLYRVTSFEIVGDHTLKIWFDDGSVQVIDFEPVLHGPVFGPLRDLALFNQVSLIDYAGCLECPLGLILTLKRCATGPIIRNDMTAIASL